MMALVLTHVRLLCGGLAQFLRLTERVLLVGVNECACIGDTDLGVDVNQLIFVMCV